MFKNLYNNIINLHTNYKLNKFLNLFSFLKKSTLLKNYSNYLNYYIYIYNNLKIKTIQTTFWTISLDSIIIPLNFIVICWIIIDFFLF